MNRLLYLAAIICPVIIFIIYPKWLVDDAYIYFRYAAHLAEQGSLAWNLGQPAVEGYTGIAWLLLLAGLIKIGLSPLFGAHLVGLAAYFAGLLALILIVRHLKLPKTVLGLTMLWYATTPLLFTHALSGLETMFFVSGLLWLVYAGLRLTSGKVSVNQVIFLLVALLLSLTRPEGLAFSGLLVLAAAYLAKQAGQLKGYLWKAIVLYGLPVCLYFGWRYSFYGQFLPNTFYVKANVGFAPHNITDLFRFLRSYLAAPLALATLLILPEFDAVISLVKKKWTDLKPPVVLLAAYGAFLVILTAQFANAHLTMNYAYRFYVPFLPFFWLTLAAIASIGWEVIAETKGQKPLRYRVSLWLVLALSLYQLFFHATKFHEEMAFVREEQAGLEAQHIAIGNFLKTAIPANEWLVAYIDAGAIPYFSGLKTVDFGGLSDSQLPRKLITTTDRVNYFYSFHPGVVVFTSTNPDQVEYGPEAAAIMADPRFKDYKLVKKYLWPTKPGRDYHEFVFIRADLLPGSSKLSTDQ